MQDAVVKLDSGLNLFEKGHPPSVEDLAQQDSDALLKTAVLLLEGLSRNVMSGDVWALSQIYVARRAVEVDLNSQQVSDCLERLMVMINRNRKANPLHSMF